MKLAAGLRALRRIGARAYVSADDLVQNGVLRGEDGWLFLWDGSNHVHRYYSRPDHFTDADATDWAGLLRDRNERLRCMGIAYRHLTVPDKLSVYPEHVPVRLAHYDRHPARLVGRLADPAVNIDILPDLRAEAPTALGRLVGTRDAAASDRYFFRTDSHWTFAGCQIAYWRMCNSLGVAPRDLSDRRSGSIKLALDLGSKLDPPVTERAHFTQILRDARRVRENAMVRYNETEGFARGTPAFVGCYVQHRNDHPHAIPQTLLLFGDSFSEFRPSLLTAMLAETFRDVHFVWSTSMDMDLLREIAPDVVITEIAERFMNRLPKDDFRVSVE